MIWKTFTKRSRARVTDVADIPLATRRAGDDGSPGQTLLNQPWSKTAEAVAAALAVRVDEGLTGEEAAVRKTRYGPNRLRAHPRRSLWRILFDQGKSLIVGLLVVAAAVAFLFGEVLEGWAVVVVILLNTAIGFFTEWRAVRSMEALFTLGTVTTRVRRDGQVRKIPAEDLVPGDVVVVEGGDVVTADLRLVESSKLQADESTLTGESLPVGKHPAPVAGQAPLAERSSMLYKGTAVTRGSGTAVVVKTGMATELGTISALVAEAEEGATPLEQRLNRLGRRLIGGTLAVAFLVVFTGIFTGKDLFLMIETGLALAVAAIPEGLPVVATIALARGLRRMARRNALVNRLSSVETLGATGVICTDKTGTLTENRMTLTRLVLEAGPIEAGGADGDFRLNGTPVDPQAHPVLRAALETGVLCNNASLYEGEAQATGDPLEVALLVAGTHAGLRREELVKKRPEVREEAFDADVKMMATVHAYDDQWRVAVKGAPEPVLDAATAILTDIGPRPLSEEERAQWLRRNEQLAAEGLRVLALATKTVADVRAAPYVDLVFIGLIGLMDPPRQEVRAAVEACRRAGIEVVMVTGDQPVTAQGIARAVGLSSDPEAAVVHGSAMKPLDRLSDEERARMLQARLFARVSPKQKLDLIELHQQAGHIVAMTGDGVNDAPALKKADIGVAMGQRGTQVAREAADMVLQDDAFSTIVAAVEEGRAIFENIRTFVRYLLSCNVSEVMVVGLAALVGTTLPILPLQILFLNLVTDVFPALALGLGAGAAGIMERPPRQANEPLITRRHGLGIVLYGVVFTAAVLAAMVLARQWLGRSPAEAVTISFLTLAFAQLWHVFNMREPGTSLWRNEITRNGYVWGAVALCTALILGAVYVPGLAAVLQVHPPDPAGWILVAGMSLVPLLVGQLGKRFGAGILVI